MVEGATAHESSVMMTTRMPLFDLAANLLHPLHLTQQPQTTTNASLFCAKHLCDTDIDLWITMCYPWTISCERKWKGKSVCLTYLRPPPLPLRVSICSQPVCRRRVLAPKVVGG